jgi:hypothetical protein
MLQGFWRSISTVRNISINLLVSTKARGDRVAGATERCSARGMEMNLVAEIRAVPVSSIHKNG